MAVHPALAMLRKSRINPIAYSSKLDEEGYSDLAENISTTGLIVNEAPVSYYIQARDVSKTAVSDAGKIAILIGREMCLKRKPVIELPMPFLIQEYRIQYTMEREVEVTVDLFKLRGKGHIIVPDFFSWPDPSDVYPQSVLHDVTNYLMQHLYDGGGLVLAGHAPDSHRLKDYGTNMPNLIASHFTTVVADRSHV